LGENRIKSMRNARVEPLKGGSVVPSFRGIFLERFLYLIEGIDDLTSSRQREAIVRELEWCGLQVAETLDRHRYRATLMVLRDLTGQGWRVQYRYKSVFLVRPDYTQGKTPLDPLTVKAQIREAMQEERLARLLAPSTQKFVRQLERNNSPRLGIQALIGDGQLLAERLLRLGADSTLDDLRGSMSPYLQLVTGEEKDKYTGLRLIDVWRYFRYLWAIPYLPTPGRNLFYLVRDAAQVNHPVIGIAALGNSIVQLSERDNRIGWSIEGLESRLNRRSRKISHTPAAGAAETIEYLESEQDYSSRIDGEASLIAKCLTLSMERELATISLRNLARASEIQKPTPALIDRLLKVAADSEHERREGLRDSETSGESLKRSESLQEWKKDSEKPLYRRKRAQALADLFFAREQFRKVGLELEPHKALRELLCTDNGRKALRIALHANKKTRIGSSMMDLIVCGAIPPYGELLGGKLVAMLMASPQVILDYKKRYGDQPSEITSRLAGRPVVRDADLVFLGTTSLYHVGSSQYERIKIPGVGAHVVRYERLGHTEGYGSSILSSETASQLKQLVIRSEGMRRVNNVFGEGVSPRLRQIRDGLNALGIPQEAVLKHSCPRIIYGVCLARNAFQYLRGEEDVPDFNFDLKRPAGATKKIIDFWLQRWLQPRSQRPETRRRLMQFSPNDLLVSNEFAVPTAPEPMSMQMETN
jgi:Domain of unknown function (DUF4338)